MVLVYVTVLGLLMALMWTLAWRATQDAIRVERAASWRDKRDASVTRAGAQALTLLSTGRPPSDPYTCLITVVDEDDSSLHVCTAEFSSVTYPHTWTVDVWEATEAEQATLADAPETF